MLAERHHVESIVQPLIAKWPYVAVVLAIYRMTR